MSPCFYNLLKLHIILLNLASAYCIILIIPQRFVKLSRSHRSVDQSSKSRLLKLEFPIGNKGFYNLTT